MNLTTEQLQQILDGAPEGAEYFDKSSNAYYKIEDDWSYFSGRPYDLWDVSVKAPYHVQNNTSGDFIKLSDIRTELDSRLSVQAYFASDERGSIEQEQSVIERFTNLAESFREIGKQYQSYGDKNQLRQAWVAAAEYIERELKEVSGDE